MLPNRNLNHQHKKYKWSAVKTVYGWVYTEFYRSRNSSAKKDGSSKSESDPQFSAATIIFVPTYTMETFHRVMFSINNSQPLTATVTYQARIPNGSPVFEKVKWGTVAQLIKAVEEGTASLTDRDEDGRSLLNVSSFHVGR
jgi:hypothetical protein